jgi:hypothetical protein
MSILFVLMPMLLATLGFLFFGDTTSAGVNEGGYVSIPQAVPGFFFRGGLISILVRFCTRHSLVCVSCNSPKSNVTYRR